MRMDIYRNRTSIKNIKIIYIYMYI